MQKLGRNTRNGRNKERSAHRHFRPFITSWEVMYLPADLIAEVQTALDDVDIFEWLQMIYPDVDEFVVLDSVG